MNTMNFIKEWDRIFALLFHVSFNANVNDVKLAATDSNGNVHLIEIKELKIMYVSPSNPHNPISPNTITANDTPVIVIVPEAVNVP